MKFYPGNLFRIHNSYYYQPNKIKDILKKKKPMGMLLLESNS